MRRELIKALIDIKDNQIISSIISNMNTHDILVLLSLLEFVDTETQNRWLGIYNQVMKVA